MICPSPRNGKICIPWKSSSVTVKIVIDQKVYVKSKSQNNSYLLVKVKTILNFWLPINSKNGYVILAN